MRQFGMSWGMLIASVLLNACGVFIIKLKLNELGKIELDSLGGFVNYFLLMLKSKLVVSGLILSFIAPVLFAVALSRMEVLVAYPVAITLNFLFLILLAMLFLGESLTLNKAVAIALVFVTIYLLHKK